jgi:hypothetical protein
MGVKLQSALGGSVELNAPSTASNYTMTAPSANGTIAITDQIFGFKNKIINGSLQVWQRGTSQSTGGFGSVDRFYFGWGSGALSVVKGQDIQPSPASVDGHYMLLGGTGLVNGYFYHAVEGVRTFAGQTCTLSYYYTNVSGTDTGGTPYIRQVFGTGGSGDVDTQPISDTSVLVNGSNQFRRTLVFNLPSVSGKTIGANNCSRIIVPCAGTFQKAYWSFQLEAGSAATSFDALPYAAELASCQRYYEKSYNQGTAPGTVTPSPFRTHIQASNQYASINGLFATPKRANPTVVSYNPATGVSGQMIADATTITSVGIVTTESGLNIFCSNQTTTMNQFLSCHWTASSEL